MFYKGPLHVKQIKEGQYKELFDAFVKAGVEAGYPYTSDPNGYMQEG
jgi:choline dehydrogenase